MEKELSLMTSLFNFQRLPITIEQLPKAKRAQKEEPCDEVSVSTSNDLSSNWKTKNDFIIQSVDPLSITDEKLEDGTEFTAEDSDSDTDQKKSGTPRKGRSEEIVVVRWTFKMMKLCEELSMMLFQIPEVYINDYQAEHNSDGDDVLRNVSFKIRRNIQHAC